MQIKEPEPVLLQKNEVTGVGKGFQVWFTATEAPTVPRRYVDTTRVRRDPYWFAPACGEMIR